MLGGFNKILRNIVAGASDTEFEKVRPFRDNQSFIETHKGHVPSGLEGAQRKTRYL